MDSPPNSRPPYAGIMPAHPVLNTTQPHSHCNNSAVTICIRRDTEAAFLKTNYAYRELVFITDKNQLKIGTGELPFSLLPEASSLLDVLLAVNFTFRRSSAAEWAIYNPVLLSGELGIDTTYLSLRVGNGKDAWNDIVPVSFKMATGVL